MAYGYVLLIVLGIIMIVAGFYGAFVYNKNRMISNLLSALMPVGLIVTLLGILLTVLPNFFKDPVW